MSLKSLHPFTTGIACCIFLLALTQCNKPLPTDYKLIWLQQRMDQQGRDTGKIDTLRIEYFQQKKLAKRINYSYDPFQKFTNNYDTAGHILTSTMERPDAPTWQLIQQFDRFGNYRSKEFGFNDIRIKHLTQNKLGPDSIALETRFLKQPANALETIESYIYDENKRITSITSYSINPQGDTSFVSYTDKAYNPNGLIVKEQNSSGADAPYARNGWEYDKTDRLVKYQRFSKEVLEEEITLQYKGDRKVNGIRNLPLKKQQYKLTFVYE